MSGLGQSNVGIKNGADVVGFFMDGDNCQQPVIFGIVPSVSTRSPNPSKGFNDPESTYPIEDKLGESDLNRLARNEKISETIVQGKKAGVVKTSTAGGLEWTEIATEYAAQYPHNSVYESACGHIIEIDNTGGAERLHTWHTSGTFNEINSKGDVVTKIVRDDYQITMRDKYVQIDGVCNVTINGNSNLLVKGDVTIETKGNHKETIDGDFDLTVKGDMTTTVTGNYDETITGTMETTASTTKTTSVVGSCSVKSGGNMSFLAPRIDLN